MAVKDIEAKLDAALKGNLSNWQSKAEWRGV